MTRSKTRPASGRLFPRLLSLGEARNGLAELSTRPPARDETPPPRARSFLRPPGPGARPKLVA